jgi:hypothetical protein
LISYPTCDAASRAEAEAAAAWRREAIDISDSRYRSNARRFGDPAWLAWREYATPYTDAFLVG